MYRNDQKLDEQDIKNESSVQDIEKQGVNDNRNIRLDHFIVIPERRTENYTINDVNNFERMLTNLPFPSRPYESSK